MRKWIFAFLLTSTNVSAGVPPVHLEVTVRNEAGIPLEGVIVQGGFTTGRYDYKPGPERKGTTNSRGVAKISGPAIATVYVTATKDGYYETERKVAVNRDRDQKLSIVLREKRNPIAMYAKKALLTARESRVSGEEFGYDMMVGDFVAPHGKGVVNDILVTHTYERKDIWNYSFQYLIRFSKPGDGLVPFYFDDSGSEYRSGYRAPADGYKGQLVLEGKREGKGKPQVGNKDPLRNYYFRIRSKQDEEGNVISAYYGKIYGEFPGIAYYLNPAENDRNVEFDVGKNLFKNLDSDERVKQP